MDAKNIHYSQTDTFRSSVFDAKDDNAFITLKTEEKNWVDDSLLGKTIFGIGQDSTATKFIAVSDTLKPIQYYKPPKFNLSNFVPSTYVKSIFSNHLLSTEIITPKFRVVKHYDWSLPIFLLSFFMLAAANIFFVKRFKLFTKAFFLSRFINQLMREDNSQTQRLSFLLSSVYFFSIAIYSVQLNEYYHFSTTPLDGFYLFLVIALSFFGFFILKYLLHNIAGFIFNVNKEINEYTFNVVLLNQFLGIALLAICFVMSYLKPDYNKVFITVGTCLIGIVFVYRIIRGFFAVSANKNISTIYLFLYFCTLEILPLVVVTKILMDR